MAVADLSLLKMICSVMNSSRKKEEKVEKHSSVSFRVYVCLSVKTEMEADDGRYTKR